MNMADYRETKARNVVVSRVSQLKLRKATATRLQNVQDVSSILSLIRASDEEQKIYCLYAEGKGFIICGVICQWYPGVQGRLDVRGKVDIGCSKENGQVKHRKTS